MLKRWRNLRHQVRVTIISTAAATLVLGVVLFMTGFLLAKGSIDVARRDLKAYASPGPRRVDFTLAEAIDYLHWRKEIEIASQQGKPRPSRPESLDAIFGGPPSEQRQRDDRQRIRGRRSGTGNQRGQVGSPPISGTASTDASTGAQPSRDGAAPQKREPSHVAVALYTLDGRLVQGATDGRETQVGNKWVQTYLNGAEIVWPATLEDLRTLPPHVLVAPPQLATSGAYMQLYIYDASDRYADIHRTNMALLALFPFLVAVLGLASYLAVGTSFKPLKRLLTQASELGFNDRLETADKAEFGQLATSINEYLDRIQAVVKQQEEFAVDAAHELCTPLTALRGELELAMMQHRDSAGYEEAAKNAVAQVTRLQRLVEGLLLATRPREASITKCDVQQILEEVQARWVDRYAAQKVNLELAAEAFKASMPEEELESVLENLLSNALKFSPAGSTVRIALDVQGHLVVEDQGPGIPESDRDRIFERFERGTTKARGFGVGLYLVRRLLEQRGGSVTIGESKIGTRVEVALPA